MHSSLFVAYLPLTDYVGLRLSKFPLSLEITGRFSLLLLCGFIVA